VRIVAEATREGASVRGVARKYGIDERLLFRWKNHLTPAVTQEPPVILPVTLSDGPEKAAALGISLPTPGPAPVIVERQTPGIEVELVGGRRVRFERDTDPETVRRLVSLLEGEAP